MKRLLNFGLLAAVAVAFYAGSVKQPQTEAGAVAAEAVTLKTKPDWHTVGTGQYEPTHPQLVWTYALEWCESRGVSTAVNPKDKDGTPSYYNFQWKPETFKGYAVRYGLLPASLELADYQNWMSDYELQREIVHRMLNDKAVTWPQEFPDCVLRKVGRPPLR